VRKGGLEPPQGEPHKILSLFQFVFPIHNENRCYLRKITCLQLVIDYATVWLALAEDGVSVPQDHDRTMTRVLTVAADDEWEVPPMAATKRFTKTVVQSLNPKEKLYEVRDSEVRGLTLRVTPTGVKTWVLVRWVRPNTERIKIGRWPDVSVKGARDAARVLIGRMAAGDNPADQRRAARAESTLDELWVGYLERHAKPNKRSWRNDELQYKKHLRRWGNRRLSEIRRSDVARMMDRIGKLKGRAGGPVAANRVRALLGSMYSWAERGGAEVANPTRGVRPFKETPRRRYLSGDEIRDLWRALRDDPDQRVADVVRLLLLIGQRSSNVLGMRQAEFDLRRKVWTIPADQIKSGRDLRVPLSPKVVEILRGRKSRGTWLFPSNCKGGHLRDMRQSFARILKRAQLLDVTPHDLRRTFATWMTATGAGLEVTAAALGHAPIGLTDTVYSHVQIETVRGAVERTVRAILSAAEGENGVLVSFPVLGGTARG